MSSAATLPPTGKLSLTMVSDPAVIAITEQEIDGVVREICASPNDVPGYDKVSTSIPPSSPTSRAAATPTAMPTATTTAAASV